MHEKDDIEDCREEHNQAYNWDLVACHLILNIIFDIAFMLCYGKCPSVDLDR